jgi:hypothetical protein
MINDINDVAVCVDGRVAVLYGEGRNAVFGKADVLHAWNPVSTRPAPGTGCSLIRACLGRNRCGILNCDIANCVFGDERRAYVSNTKED